MLDSFGAKVFFNFEENLRLLNENNKWTRTHIHIYI